MAERASPPKPRARPKAKTSKRPSWKRQLLVVSAVLALFGLQCGTLAGTWYYHELFKDMPALPETAELWTLKREPATEFRDANGTLIDIRGPRYGREVRIADLPVHVPLAFIAAEDKRFYNHNGADTRAIIRAAWSNWRSGKTVSGASTITQQVIKNLILDPRQTVKRKAQEVALARQLEEQMSKDEILELYLNRIYFGAGFYGLDAASTHYFGKPPAELTVGEAALLAALPQAPSRLALHNNMDEAQSRQDYVLHEMVSAGFLSASGAAAASDAPIELVERTPPNPQHGYLLDLAVRHVAELVPDAPPDLVVTLTVDLGVQDRIYDSVTKRIAEEGPDLSATQAGAIVFRRNGSVAALFGGVDYELSEFNRATQARRQPGSSFKAIVFAAALKAGIRPHHIRTDGPLRIEGWQPRNYTGIYLGPVTVAEAFAESLNTVAAQLTQEVGELSVIELAKDMGITSPLTDHPSIALGSEEVTLWDITRAYGAFMTGGTRLEPYLISQIEDSRGNLIYAHVEPELARVLPERVTRDITSMMVQTIAEGTGQSAQIEDWTLAGKTGTSQGWRDAWFIGYAQPVVTGIWVGNDDDSAMERVTGGGLPALLFADIMAIALDGERATPLPGAERYVAMGPGARERVDFYRGLASAFATVSQRDVAVVQTARATRQ